LHPPHPPAQPFLRRTLQIIDETERWLVVVKPPHLEAHPSKPNGRFTLWHALRELLAFELANGGQVSLINRLDRETSGITLIAKSRDAARELHQLMEQRAIAKQYLALAWGWPSTTHFRLDWPLCRQGIHSPSRIYLRRGTHPEGATAITDCEVLQLFERPSSNGTRFCLLRCSPITGRMHQIRVHLALAGHPVVGDKIYGPDEECYLQFVAGGWSSAMEEVLLLPRHALHSCRMTIPSLQLDWQSPLPDDLRSWLETAISHPPTTIGSSLKFPSGPASAGIDSPLRYLDNHPIS